MGAAMLMNELPLPESGDAPTRFAPGQTVALAISLLLHVAAAALLLGWRAEPPLSAAVMSVETRLIALPPAPQVAPQMPPLAPQPPAPEAAVVEAAPPAPAADAELARRRIERDEQLRQQRVEQRRRERQRSEQQLREQAEQRAAAEQVRLDAERTAAAQAAADAEAASRRYQPIEKIAPGYPARAMERRIEGDCTVSYTVSSRGRVENPEVIGECHPLFVVPSLTAAKRFRYQPRMVEGGAAAVPGVTNTFHYRIRPQE